MGCDVIKGRLLLCKTAVGGLKRIYFVNKADEGTYTLDADGNAVASFGGAGTPAGNAVQYELYLGNNLTQNINSSDANGTTFFEQVLSLTLKKMTQEDNTNLLNVIKGRPIVIVEDNMGNLFIVGKENGASVSAGTALTGDAMGDLNGYTLVLTANEPNLANFYLSAVSDDFIVVAGVEPA